MSEQKFSPNIADQQRIVIALGVVATDIAILAISGEYKLVSSVIGGLFFVPALFSFLFIILTAAHLKYRSVGDIGQLTISHGLRRWSYDISINAYWWALILVTLIFVALVFGWDGQSKTFLAYWPTFFISGGFLALIVLITSGLFRKKSKAKSGRSNRTVS